MVSNHAPPRPVAKLHRDNIDPHAPPWTSLIRLLPKNRLSHLTQLPLFGSAYLRLRATIARRPRPRLDLYDNKRRPVGRHAHQVRLADANVHVATDNPEPAALQIPSGNALAASANP